MASAAGRRAIVRSVATPGEKKALLFLSLVAVLGAATRLVSASHLPVPSAADANALDRQIQVVDSVRRRRGAGDGGRRKARVAGRRALGGDVATQGAGRSTKDAGLFSPPPAPRSPPVDVDVAPIEALESLPGIGPALARRIAASRDSSGPFGSLEELQSRVRGVGPVLAKRLAPAVTFSAPRSPPSAERTEPFENGATPSRGTRRRRH